MVLLVKHRNFTNTKCCFFLKWWGLGQRNYSYKMHLTICIVYILKHYVML